MTRVVSADTESPFRRHHEHRFEDWQGTASFTKVAHDAESVDDLRHEADVLRLLHRDLPLCPAPRILDWSEADATLRVEAVNGGNLADSLYATGLLDVSATHHLGTALAMLHRKGRAAASALGPASTGPRGVHRPTPVTMRRLSAGAMDVVGAIQRVPELCAHLDRLCVAPAPETLIHGDVRFENVLVGDAGICLVDWEFAGAGEALWDVALAIAWCTSAWLSSIPQVPGISPDRLLHAADLRLPVLRPGLRALWSSYREAIAGDGSTSLPRCLELTAVRLVQLAVEAADDAEDIRAVSVLHLQVAENLLEDPASACEWLLGRSLVDESNGP